VPCFFYGTERRKIEKIIFADICIPADLFSPFRKFPSDKGLAASLTKVAYPGRTMSERLALGKRVFGHDGVFMIAETRVRIPEDDDMQ
jgi:hypothetical protein